MKKEYASPQPSLKNLEAWGFTWHEFVMSLPSLLFVATTYKSNGKPNACLQSWATFNSNHAVLSSVNIEGHLYKTVKETGVVVLNFPSAEVYPHCAKTIQNNGFEDDELALSGLTAEAATMVNAPRIKECFLNLECKFLWEKQIAPGDNHVVMCVEIVNVVIESEYLNEKKKGRYGETGLLYNIHHPINPEDFGGTAHDYLGTLTKTVDMGKY
jgi:flavin reductase (DIM6/NTAB) family NADH-FMN oxidoreductase RutF